jgi:hypothetical protein
MNLKSNFQKLKSLLITNTLAQIAAASPALEKQGFLALVFISGNTAESWK